MDVITVNLDPPFLIVEGKPGEYYLVDSLKVDETSFSLNKTGEKILEGIDVREMQTRGLELSLRWVDSPRTLVSEAMRTLRNFAIITGADYYFYERCGKNLNETNYGKTTVKPRIFRKIIDN